MLRVSTREWVPEDRVERWREEFGRHITGADVEALGATASQFHVDMRLQRGAGLAMTDSRFAAVHQHRNRSCLSDGDDACTVLIATAGTTAFRHNGFEGVLHRGDVAVFSHGRTIDITWRHAAITTVLAPRAILAPLFDLDGLAGTIRPAARAATRLLVAYAGVAFATGLPAVAETHLPALIADAVAAENEADDRTPARQDARRAARLVRITAAVNAMATSGPVTAEVLGRRLGVSARTVQRDLASIGSSVQDQVTARRLEVVNRWLTDASEMRTISAMAFDAGFNDLSHFNRAYRARFGETPRDTRG